MLLSLSVERVGNVQHLRIDFEDRVEVRASLVDLLEALDVHTRKLAGAQPPCGHQGLELSDARHNEVLSTVFYIINVLLFQSR